ncbi:efflux RND transporter periplasmic adaptor subunit [Rhizobium sp. BK251]|uniref:efflux RND transporter periplasmic adaptor subunit n=1 Tax=Rhizobium sp. BK251 TaxID=2512125 RepID=UPI00104F0378|nr:efflux RND transporter periplasmic adaptor subunit [Rhizobium sp. BK251]TCL73790.1 multidrug efflux system membrane fusion protein [Rhizobium sp. BK251]
MNEPEISEKPRRRGVRRTGVSLLLIVLVVGVGGTLWLRHDDESSAATPPDPGVPVTTALSVQGDVPIYLSGLGTVQAFNTVTVTAQVNGTLVDVRFKEGQMVKKGDVLAVIDPRPFQDTLDEAVAKLKQDEVDRDYAKVTLDRDLKLDNQSVTQQTVDNQRSTYHQLEAQVNQDNAAIADAQTQLSYTQIISPLDGRTGIRLLDQGNVITTTDTTGLVVITQTKPISVISTLPETDLPAVQEAMKAGAVTVTALTKDGGSALGSGTLTVLDNEIDQTTGTIRLKSTFPNEDETLWPGEFVQLRVQQRVEKGVVTVPSAAVQRGSDGYFIYVVKPDSTVDARPVKVGQIEDNVAIVETGLKAGETVVTAGQYRLEPGIKVMPEDNSSQTPATDSKKVS